MIVRNIQQEEVLRGLYRAHGGGKATMLFDSSVLRGILFLAHGVLGPGKRIEAHRDPYEEIYYVLEGEGIMMVGGEEERIKPGDAVWVPGGTEHAMENDGDQECKVLVIAGKPESV